MWGTLASSISAGPMHLDGMGRCCEHIAAGQLCIALFRSLAAIDPQANGVNTNTRPMPDQKIAPAHHQGSADEYSVALFSQCIAAHARAELAPALVRHGRAVAGFGGVAVGLGKAVRRLRPTTAPNGRCRALIAVHDQTMAWHRVGAVGVVDGRGVVKTGRAIEHGAYMVCLRRWCGVC